MRFCNQHNKVLIILTASLVGLITFPVLYIFFQNFSYALLNYEEAFSGIVELRTIRLLLRSALLALTVSLLATLVALPLGYYFANYNFPLRKLLVVLIVLPFFIPPYIYAISWINLVENEAVIKNVLNISVYGFQGTAFVLTCWLFPLSFFFMVSTSRKNQNLEEAASLARSRLTRFFRITLPLMLPGLLAGMIFTFILAITNFSVPGALRLNVYPSEIFIQFGAFFNHDQAFFLSFPVILFSGAIVLLFFAKYGGRLKSSEQKSDAVRLKSLSKAKLISLFFFLIVIVAIVLLLPVVSLIVGTANLRFFVDTFLYNHKEIWQTVLYSAATALMLTITGFYLAFFRRTLAKPLLKVLLDILLLMQLTIPGTVFGIAMVKLLQTVSLHLVLSDPFSAVFISSLRYLTVSYFICVAGFARLPEKYLEAATLLSGRQWANFQRIILPLNKESIIGSWIIVFVLCFNEIDGAIMMYPPGYESVALRIYSLLHYGANNMVFALSLMQLTMIVLFVLLCYRWINKSILNYA